MNKFGLKTDKFASIMLIDASTPLILKILLIDFSPEITNFLEKGVPNSYITDNGINISLSKDFTYKPTEMETIKGYLSGFSSNMSQSGSNQLLLLFMSEDEKLKHKETIITAMDSLLHKALDLTESDPRFIIRL